MGLVVSGEIPNLQRGNAGWFGPEVWFADWRGCPPADYATNVGVCSYYAGVPCKGLRKADLEEINRRLQGGDTLVFGCDYYSLFGLSSFYFPDRWLQQNAKRLENGGVIYLRVHGTQKGIVYEPMEVQR